ncbi:MAG TPA: GNAT family N-acetyltransferase [Nitrospira sp.]|nr:GNAT family N-acetyltransferase [Nitrospira sp.]
MNRREAPPFNSDRIFELRNDVRPGDLGSVISLHGSVFAQECGFDSAFEAQVARHLGEFIPARTSGDRLWLAERQRRLVGSVAIVSHSEKDAQVCWLLVDPSARSLGLGRRLLQEAIAFCRRRRYEYVFLRSFRVLAAASRLFRSVGFEKVEERPSACWGVAGIEESYVLHPLEQDDSLPVEG